MKFSINNKEIQVAKSDILNCDSLVSINNRLEKYTSDYNKKFSIAMICAPLMGFGDLMFGIKFLKTFIDRFNNKINISFFIKDNLNYLDAIVKSGIHIKKIYNTYGHVAGVKGKDIQFFNESSLTIYILDDASGKTPRYVSSGVPADLLLITPGTNVNKFFITFDNKDIHKYSFVLSEFNTHYKNSQIAAVDSSEVSINPGVYNSEDCDKNDFCASGVFLPDFKIYDRPSTDLIPEGRYYSVTYIYTNEDNVKDIYLNNEPTNNYIENVMEHVVNHTNKRCEPFNDSLRRGYLILCVNLFGYLSDLNTYRKENNIDTKIIVLVDNMFTTNFELFLSKEKENSQEKYLDTLWNWLTHPKSPFEFKKRPSLSQQEMLGLFQHSIPITFLSGDQTSIEFISINDSDRINLYYMTFYWQRAFAESLGITVKNYANRINGAGSTIINRTKFLQNISNNFNITGMSQVENLIAYAIKKSKITCENVDKRNITLRLNDGTFLYQFNLESDKLVFKLRDNSFITDYIKGKYSPISQDYPDILISSFDKNRNCKDEQLFSIAIDNEIYTCEDFMNVNCNNPDEMNKIANFTEHDMQFIKESCLSSCGSDLCKKDVFIKYFNNDENYKIIPVKNNDYTHFYIDTLTKLDNSVISIPIHINSMMINKILNDRIINSEEQEDEIDLDTTLVKSYATIVNTEMSGAKTAMLRNPNINSYNPNGIFLFQQYIQDSIPLRDFIRTKTLSPTNFNKLLLLIIITLRKLKDIQLVHNDLWLNHILVVKYNTEEVIRDYIYGIHVDFNTNLGIRIIDFDNASYNYQCKRFISNDAVQEQDDKYNKSKDYLNYYDILYALGDILDIYEFNDFNESSTQKILQFLYPGLPDKNKYDLDVSQYVSELMGKSEDNCYIRNESNKRLPRKDLKNVRDSKFRKFISKLNDSIVA